MVAFIIAQILGIIALGFSLKSFIQTKKEKYAEDSIFSNIFKAIHYLLLNAYSALLVKIIAIIRELVIYKKAKGKSDNIFVFIIVSIIYIIIGFITYNNQFTNLLPIISAFSYFIAEWFGSIKTIKIVAIITTIIWLIYDIIIFAISSVIHNIITIIFIIYSMKKRNN